ncbi:ABC-type transport system ATPase component [Sphingobium herbicidovorans NBRC 16415]|uniref:ABC-type transport system ATPase component n=1 Tax=Sphingobium herbicidovorans (strain ATCC 700291 / DSM 11019 / CCUG 56400 / KCTC 2939 / LMG 18315 / NBRC 16415 / MH) TaxID=1219045 RepID=A0A086P9E2_SPHHM|nr:ABC transporter ATP-binding protein [Sphingobium herbicidovorans]KFG90010.1 ABC-type transport system ATPase component [Sphingobium herbicidovorans NBRC 16415]
MSAIIEVEGVSRSLPGTPPVTLVADVSLSIQPATFVAIVGPSGCGKSSLLYLLGLLDRPTKGHVLFNGQDMNPLRGDARAQIRLASFGFVFQFHFLLPEFTALENVMLPMRRLGKRPLGEIRAKAQALLEGMGLGEKSAKTPDRLSGGERQRVAIARAIANDPALVLGDEPTGNLDSQNSARVVDMFRNLAHEQGRAVVCVTHDPDVAAAADVQISMLDGRIKETSVRPR